MICPHWLLASWLTVMYHRLIDLFLDTGTFSPMGMAHCSVCRCHPNNLSEFSDTAMNWRSHNRGIYGGLYTLRHTHCLFGIYKGLLLCILQWKSSNLLKWCYKRRSASWGGGKLTSAANNAEFISWFYLLQQQNWPWLCSLHHVTHKSLKHKITITHCHMSLLQVLVSCPSNIYIKTSSGKV